ncbi:hypothetical protein ACWDR7_05385 [Microbacterium sp. NPDC003461]
MAGTSVNLVLAGSGRRRDLAVPSDVTVRELLRASGLDPLRMGVIGPAGDPLPLDEPVGEGLSDGSLLWVFDTAAAADASRAADEAQRRRARAGGHPAVRVAVLVTLAVALTIAAVLQPQTPWAAVAAAALALGAGALAFHPEAAENDVRAMLVPIVAFAAGAVASSGTASPQAVLTVGAVCAATAACLRHGYGLLRRQPVLPVTGISAVTWTVTAAVLAVCFLFALPTHTPAALLLGAVPLAFRALTPASVPIDEEDLLDMPFLIRDAPGVRETMPRPPRRVARDDIAGTIREAGRRRDSGAILLAAISAVSAWALLDAVPAGTVAAWCALGGVAGVAAFLGLTSRTAHRGITKVATGVGATATLVPLVLHAAPLWPLLPLLLALALVVCGLIAVLLIRPAQAGWRSLGWSRTGDMLEVAFVALTPAVLLYASGIIDEIGRRIA